MKLKYEFAIKEVCGLWCAVPVGSAAGRYSGIINLNATAADMMKMLSQDITEEQLVQQMLALYDVPEDALRRDVKAFIARLEAENVLA